MLWSKISKGLSAGRVQSVALRIICDREREIIAFIPKEYWLLTANFATTVGDIEYKGKFFGVDGKKLEIVSADDALKIGDAVEKNKSCRIGEITKKRKLKYAPPPFITSTLQQAAVQYLRISASQVMRIAQQLYEGVEIGGDGATGLITYMRTDSVSVSKEALSACRSFIESKLGADFLPEKPNFFKSSRNAQEAHEAIRPTDVFRSPENMKKFLNHEQFRLYSLIWKRFTASQMRPAEYDISTVATIVEGADAKNYEFRTGGSTLVFQGFLKIYENKVEEEREKDDELDGEGDFKNLFALKEASIVALKKLDREQKFTEPPPRFSEATLIKELDSNGIGRPSTYATILSTILSRKYVERAKGRLAPTELGFKVNDTLVRTVPELFQIGFTAEMETELDKIEEGGLDWKKMLSEFYDKFSVWLKEAKADGAPANEKVKMLLIAIEGIKKWNAPEKVGKRTYDDKKFFDSVKEHFESSEMISEKQWGALVSVAGKYREQIVNFDFIASKLKILDILKKSDQEKAERLDPDNLAKLTKIAAIVDELAILAKQENKVLEGKEKAVKNKYNDLSFLDSFSKRLLRGIPLSDKQSAVLARIAVKHKDSLKSFDEVSKIIGVDENNATGAIERKTTGEKENARIVDLLSELKKVNEWREGRGRRDDKSFFNSLSKQFSAKGALSEKQFAALEKMAMKYLGEGEQNSLQKKTV
jgi:DNA topoisomerase-1